MDHELEILFAQLAPWQWDVLIATFHDRPAEAEAIRALRDRFHPLTEPPVEPCGCIHYNGRPLVICQGPHTRGEGAALRWAP